MASLDHLTRRQRECLALVSVGLTSKEIAAVLGIEPATVDVTLKRAARRAGMSDRRRLARLLADEEPELTQSLLQQLGHGQKRLVFNDIEPEQAAVRSAGDDVASGGIAPPSPVLRATEDLSATEKRLLALAVAFAAIATLLALVRLSKVALTAIAA